MRHATVAVVIMGLFGSHAPRRRARHPQAGTGESPDHATNWLTNAPLSEWFGVEVDGDGRVTGLRLPGNGLSGSIPSSLGELSNLERLYLDKNKLTGRIPDALGDLSILRVLWLEGNGLTGPIPSSFGELSNLAVLVLDENKLTGRNPVVVWRAVQP